MFRITRKRLAGISSVFTMALVLVLAPAALARGPVVHHVNAGGPDACIFFGFAHPGCDANFSLVANAYADGSVKANIPIDSHREMAFTLSSTASVSSATTHG